MRTLIAGKVDAPSTCALVQTRQQSPYLRFGYEVTYLSSYSGKIAVDAFMLAVVGNRFFTIIAEGCEFEPSTLLFVCFRADLVHDGGAFVYKKWDSRGHGV
jgi:hypothetical protein